MKIRDRDPVRPDQSGRMMPVDPMGTNAPREEVVRRKAYEIYEKRGREQGNALQHWLEAESITDDKDGGHVMRDLIAQLKSRAGLDDEKANVAVQTVLDFLKQRLPKPAARQLDSIVSGIPLGGVAGVLGSMFEKRTG